MHLGRSFTGDRRMPGHRLSSTSCRLTSVGSLITAALASVIGFSGFPRGHLPPSDRGGAHVGAMALLLFRPQVLSR